MAQKNETGRRVPSMGRVLVIAGSDPSGGAGIQADIKTITMLGQYAATAITAITVQNTLGVRKAVGIEPKVIADQINAVLEDIGADAVKTGMLHSADVVETVVGTLRTSGFRGSLVVDPVMVASSGDRLVDDAAVSIVREQLIPMAALVTPNLPEAGVLANRTVSTKADMLDAGRAIKDMGASAVLMKGGHLDSDVLTDFLITGDDVLEISQPKLSTRHTHGTGCTFASALAALLAGGDDIETAFPVAHRFVQEAIAHAPGFGAGHGPLGHASVKL